MGDHHHGEPPKVFEDFKRYFESSKQVAVPVAAIKALTEVIKRSNATTMMGVERELRSAAEELKKWAVEPFGVNTVVSLAAGCELFLCVVSRTAVDFSDFNECRKLLIETGERFLEVSLRSRARIAEIGHRFVRDGAVVLTHAKSRCVEELLFKAAETKNFSVIVTECRPDCSGYEAARSFSAQGIPVTLIQDSAVGYFMEKVDIVLLGAESVMESGGIVNKIGTHQIAIVAKACNKPVYVAVESYKFTRLFPLSQRDLPQSQMVFDPSLPLPPSVKVESPSSDFTDQQYIKLLFTDLGVLTPSAISDELIKLYQ